MADEHEFFECMTLFLTTIAVPGTEAKHRHARIQSQKIADQLLRNSVASAL